MLMPFSVGGFRSVSVSIENCAPPNWARPEAVATDSGHIAVQDYALVRVPPKEDIRVQRQLLMVVVSTSCWAAGGTCAGHAGDSVWKLLGFPLDSTGLPQIGQPNEKYDFRTRWSSAERLQKWRWTVGENPWKGQHIGINERPYKQWNVSLSS